MDGIADLGTETWALVVKKLGTTVFQIGLIKKFPTALKVTLQLNQLSLKGFHNFSKIMPQIRIKKITQLKKSLLILNRALNQIIGNTTNKI